MVFLAITAFALYGLMPKLLDMWDQVPNLREISAVWFACMVLAQAASYVCAWQLMRIALRGLSWFVAATSQLTSNAVAKIVPGGAAIGAGVGYRMMATAGVDRGSAGAALAANSIISNGVLLCLPLVALVMSILTAPIPTGMDHVAWGGAALFVVLFGFVFALVRYDRPIRVMADAISRSSHWVLARFHRTGGPTPEGIIRQRDEMVASLGSRWKGALGAAVGNWMFDYFALVFALIAVGVRPRLSLVLLAYAVASLLTMIPITPGGVGFVEAGLVAMLTLAGVPGESALLATLAYRVVSYWLPLPAGLVAHLLYRHRYRPRHAEPSTSVP